MVPHHPAASKSKVHAGNIKGAFLLARHRYSHQIFSTYLQTLSKVQIDSSKKLFQAKAPWRKSEHLP